ncbi:glycosyltransferase 87 family protein [Corynebacterium comes]|uniref:Polyprenol-phosphate-mannose-dependent alpha-(1-2)-phosphatidylinositol mannoside mannosyltransferase n=1 Tax=Corynebacterium comes TaxID=2675218 RepID=A0A6B8VLR5_9CORY|nr:glycosyltransferase 87 family protein [Corynebacterium comes]QGU05023.1 Polyprenol-phosphate-mannose-dependent alpha-(1-2)-phosphatidylinositol mannoside mannosyltransferase [Corynebacterium comes]
MQSISVSSPAAPRFTLPHHRIGVILAILASTAALLPWLIDSGPSLRYAIDIDVYRQGARAFLASDNLYTRSYQVGGIELPFTYPPLAAILFIPLALVPYGVALVGWTLLSAVLLGWCLTIVLRHVFPTLADADHRVLATWLLPLALVAEPVRETLAFGQINIILMALVLADTLTRRPLMPRGVLIGLAAAIKLTPAVFILVFLVQRQWRSAAITFLAGVGFTLAAAAFSLDTSLTYWLNTLTDTGRIGNEAYSSNQSIRGLLARLVEPGEQAPTAVWLVLVFACLGLIIAAMLRVQRYGQPIGVVLLASTVALVCSPVSWSHHWVWLIPLGVTLLGVAWQRRNQAAVLAVLIFAAVFSSPHWLLPNDYGREYGWSWWAHVAGNSYLVVVLAVVVAAVIVPQVLVPVGRREEED